MSDRWLKVSLCEHCFGRKVDPLVQTPTWEDMPACPVCNGYGHISRWISDPSAEERRKLERALMEKQR